MLFKANNLVMLHVLKLEIFYQNPLKVLIGVKQGDPPGPFSFNIYMNDLCSDLLNSNNIYTPKISALAVHCLFWADDLVLISGSNEGVQQHLNVLERYCKD